MLAGKSCSASIPVRNRFARRSSDGPASRRSLIRKHKLGLPTDGDDRSRLRASRSQLRKGRQAFRSTLVWQRLD